LRQIFLAKHSEKNHKYQQPDEGRLPLWLRRQRISNAE